MSLQVMAEPVMNTHLQMHGQSLQAPMQTLHAPMQTVQRIQMPMDLGAFQPTQTVPTYGRTVAPQTSFGAPVRYNQGLSMQMPVAPAAAPTLVMNPPHVNYQQASSVQIPASAHVGGARVAAVPSVAMPPGMPRSPADMLASGSLVRQVQISDMDLRASGNLVTDAAADARVQAQLAQMGGSFVPIAAGPFQPIAEPLQAQSQYEMPPPQVSHQPAPPVTSIQSTHSVQSNTPHAVSIQSQPHVEMPPVVAQPEYAPPAQQTNATDCEWMYGDVAMGWLGFHELAHLNPMRWSGSKSFEQVIYDLQDTKQKELRPILLKIPANCSDNDIITCDDQTHAIETICSMTGIVLQNPVPVPSVPLTGAAARLARAGFQ